MSSSPPPLVTVTENGLYCPPGDFYIDPWRPVETAVITHAHGDHLRHGSKKYWLAEPGIGIARHRLSADDRPDTLTYGERMELGATTISSFDSSKGYAGSGAMPRAAASSSMPA